MMNALRRVRSGLSCLSSVVCVSGLLVGCASLSPAADTQVQVRLDTKKAEPRSVESLTERGILRDYRFAWFSLAQALEFNTLDPLDGPFAGEARLWLHDTVTDQQRSGLSRRYSGQNHKVEAVFYAPEGDVMQLHDTAEYELQFLDGGKVIREEHVVQHFIVLMTPGADRWVVRQLQAVPQF